MRRRHRRVLFNLFAFLLLGIAIYLNMYRMNDGGIPSNYTAKIKKIDKPTEQTGGSLKITSKENQKN
jgi:hypothetical protein